MSEWMTDIRTLMGVIDMFIILIVVMVLQVYTYVKTHCSSLGPIKR